MKKRNTKKYKAATTTQRSNNTIRDQRGKGGTTTATITHITIAIRTLPKSKRKMKAPGIISTSMERGLNKTE